MSRVGRARERTAGLAPGDMCGIVGAVGLVEKPAPELVERLLDSIRQSGPEGDGYAYRAGSLLVDLQTAGRSSLRTSPRRALLLASLPDQTGLAA